jgi:hypothetical protein
MVVSNVTYLVNWKTAAMPHHLAAAVWCCVAEKTHLRASWPASCRLSFSEEVIDRPYAATTYVYSELARMPL